jgi:sulfate/thiosulfate-binding protein
VRPSRSVVAISLLGLGLAGSLAACGSSSSAKAGASSSSSPASASSGTASAATGGGSGGKLNLVAYSTPQKAFATIIPAFKATPDGAGVSFGQSFGASGSQARAVIAGQPADVVELSLTPDVTKLVKAGLVSSDWNTGQYKGIVTDSVVSLVVRKGNPKNIKTWADLAKPGIKVVTPNPFSSGSAEWNLMGLYGSQIKEGKTQDQALAFVKSVLKNTVAQPASGSLATQAFVGGTGDVLISYENEAIGAQLAGKAVDYVTPPDTLLIENPVAVISSSKNKTTAENFVKFLYTDQAQKLFAAQGYRPVVAADLDATKFPTPAQLFTIQAFGGWSAVTTKFFDPTNGLISKIENSLGVSGG